MHGEPHWSWILYTALYIANHISIGIAKLLLILSKDLRYESLVELLATFFLLENDFFVSSIFFLRIFFLLMKMFSRIMSTIGDATGEENRRSKPTWKNNWVRTNYQQTDQRMDGPTDGHNLIISRFVPGITSALMGHTAEVIPFDALRSLFFLVTVEFGGEISEDPPSRPKYGPSARGRIGPDNISREDNNKITI